jgi:signal peptidase II
MSGTARRRPFNGVSLIIAVIWLALDQVTKAWAAANLQRGRIIHVIWTLQFNLSHNSGMAFGRGRGFGPVVGVLALVVVTALLVGLRTNDAKLSSIAVGLVVGGAAGNIVDRLVRGGGWLRGSVIDFIDFKWWPVFNVADIGVTVGGVLLVVGSLWVRNR